MPRRRRGPPPPPDPSPFEGPGGNSRSITARERHSPTRAGGAARQGPPPRSQWQYCNSGYYLIEEVIGQVIGESWDEWLPRLVLDPCAMKATRCASGASGAGRHDPTACLPHGYQRIAGRWQPAREMSSSHLRAAGGLQTTLDDVVSFQSALFGGRLLSRAPMARMFTPVTLSDGSRAPYGLGWFVGELMGHPMVSHGGGMFGFVAHMLYLPREQIFAAILSNREDRTADPSIARLTELIALECLRETAAAPTPNQAIDLPDEYLKKLAGTYRLSAPGSQGQVRSMVFQDGALHYDQGQGSLVRMVPETKERFIFEGHASLIVFESDTTGAPTGMVLLQGGEGGRRIEFERVD